MDLNAHRHAPLVHGSDFKAPIIGDEDLRSAWYGGANVGDGIYCSSRRVFQRALNARTAGKVALFLRFFFRRNPSAAESAFATLSCRSTPVFWEILNLAKAFLRKRQTSSSPSSLVMGSSITSSGPSAINMASSRPSSETLSRT